MARHKIELNIQNIYASQDYNHSYALVLKEKEGDRLLTIIVGELEARSIIMEWKGISSPRPMTHNLMGTILRTLNVSLMQVVIYREEKGTYSTFIYLKAGNNLIRIDSRTSDAVALAIRMQAPIYTYDDIINHNTSLSHGQATDTAFVGYDDARSNHQLAMEYSEVQRLEEEMKLAVAAEDYEHAAQLRDRINQIKAKEE